MESKLLKLKFVGNHWYPCVNHDAGYLPTLDPKIDKYLSIIDLGKSEEITIEFEELGVVFSGINIIYFNESDIVRYLTTEDYFDLRFVINDHEFIINSDLYWYLENQYNFEFHKNSYKIHIY